MTNAPARTGVRLRKTARIMVGSMAAFLLVQAVPTAMATNYFWDTIVTGTWATGTNWSTSPTGSPAGTTAPGSTDTAVFNGSAVNGNETVQLDASTAIEGIIFSNTGATRLQSSSATPQPLTIGASGILVNSGAGAVTIGNTTNQAPITLDAAQSWTNNASTTFTIVNAVTNGANLLTIAGTGSNTTITGAIGSGAGGLSKIGSGGLTLTGNNTYTGTTTISAGAVSANAIVVGAISAGASSLGNAASAVVLGDGVNKGTLTYTGAVATYTRGFTINAGGGQITHSGTAGLTIGTGGVAAGGLFTVNVTSGLAARAVTVSSAISGAGGLMKNGSGFLTLDNTANSYSGDTTINAGTLTLGAANVIPDGAAKGNVSVATGTTLDLNGFSETLNGLSGSGIVDNKSITLTASSTLTIGGNNADGNNFSGAIRNSLFASGNSRSLALTKIGTGTQTLSGFNTYEGATNVNGGTLLVDTVSGSLSGSGNVSTLVNVNNTGTLGGSGGTIGAGGAGTSTTTVNVNAGGTLAPGNGASLANIGTLNIGTTAGNTVIFNGSSGNNAVLAIKLNAGSSSSDLLAINGNLDLNGVDDQLTLILLNGASATGSYTIATYTGTRTGTFDTILGMPVGYTVDYGTTSNGSIMLIPVPEPGAVVSLLGGLGMLLVLQRSRRRP